MRTDLQCLLANSHFTLRNYKVECEIITSLRNLALMIQLYKSLRANIFLFNDLNVKFFVS